MQFKNFFKKIILMAIMGHLFFSCITIDKSVGSDYVPESQLLKVKIARFRLPVELKMLDSLQGSSMNYATIGAFNTSQFGVAKFGTAGNVCPNTSAWDPGEDIKIISTSMTMALASPNAALSSSNSSTATPYYDPYAAYYDPYYGYGGYGGYGYGYGYEYGGYGGYGGYGYGYGYPYYPSYSTNSEMVSSIDRTSIVLDPSQNGITQNINVYRLKKAIDSTQTYTNSLTEENYIPVALNTSAATYFGGDSITFYLSNNYGEELIKATKEERDSLKLFVERHGGLFITCDTPMNLDAGRLNLFKHGGITINVKYNFQPTWGENLARKDTTATFAFGYGGCLNTSSYSSKHLETAQQLEKLPIEGVAGINPYVNMKSLKDTLDKWASDNGIDPAKVLISKATMIFPFEFPDNLEMLEYRYPSYLFPAHRAESSDTTSKGRFYYPYDDYNLQGSTMGAINRSLAQYSCEVSTTLQKVMNMQKSELGTKYDFWLYPLMYETDETYGTTYYYIDNYSYFMGEINGPKAERYPELEIVYAVMH